MINLGESIEVLAPAVLEFPQLPQLALAVERQRHPRVPVLGVPEHHDAAVWMMGFGWSALDHRKAPQRPAVVGNLAVGAKEMSIVVARVQDCQHVLPAEELPVPVKR